MAEHTRQHTAKDGIHGARVFVDEAKKTFAKNGGFRLFRGCYIPSNAPLIRGAALTRSRRLDDTCRIFIYFQYYPQLRYPGFRFAHLVEALSCFCWRPGHTSWIKSQSRLEKPCHRLCLNPTKRIGLPSTFPVETLSPAPNSKNGCNPNQASQPWLNH